MFVCVITNNVGLLLFLHVDLFLCCECCESDKRRADICGSLRYCPVLLIPVRQYLLVGCLATSWLSPPPSPSPFLPPFPSPSLSFPSSFPPPSPSPPPPSPLLLPPLLTRFVPFHGLVSLACGYVVAVKQFHPDSVAFPPPAPPTLRVKVCQRKKPLLSMHTYVS